MTEPRALTPEQIRALEAENPKLRARDAAEKMGITEAQLVAARIGLGVTRIAPHPNGIIPAAEKLGEVLALTRVDACVHEKVGEYGNFHPGEHASMTLTKEIDLRIFPAHWVYAYAVEIPSEKGPRRSLQIFDAAGDAVHKIHLRDASNHDVWPQIVAELAHEDQSAGQDVAARQPVAPAKSNPEKAAELRNEWGQLTDTHQFLRLCSKLKMNRLGAYRVAGTPFARPLAIEAINLMLQSACDTGLEIMIFVGNLGCIQIHTGPIHNLRPMGPWQNIMDPGFDMHLRLDKVAEIWAVDKPTKRGPAVSVEAFDAEGGLIFQVFGLTTKELDSRPDWNRLVEGLPTLETVPA